MVAKNFNLTVSVENGVAHVRLRGALDDASSQRLHDRFEELFRKGQYRIVVHLREVTHGTSTAVGVFALALERATRHNGDVILLEVPSPFRQLFSLLGITELFSFVESESEALDVLDRKVPAWR